MSLSCAACGGKDAGSHEPSLHRVAWVAAVIGPGVLILVVGPSGAGKDTLIRLARGLLAGHEAISFPRRVVTREPSPYEENLMVTPEEFAQAESAGSFALSWQAHGHCYGLDSSIDGDIHRGGTVVVNVSRAIIAEAKERYRNVAVVLVTAPPAVLAERVAARRRASDGAADARLRRAASEAFVPDLVIDNIGKAEDHARALAAMILQWSERVKQTEAN